MKSDIKDAFGRDAAAERENKAVDEKIKRLTYKRRKSEVNSTQY